VLRIPKILIEIYHVFDYLIAPQERPSVLVSGSTYRRNERRRSTRVTLSIPLRVDGQDTSGEDFTVRTKSYTVSQYGCLLQLDPEIAHDQTVVLMNEHTRQSIMCTVVSTRRLRDGRRYVGVSFLASKSNFWSMFFSKPGAKSLKRQYGAEV
jgi:PilZ domain